MITERLSDPQLYTVMGIVLSLALAAALSVIAWLQRAPQLDAAAGFRWVRR
ncbi:hypothetical protein HAP48_0037300 [Bradyrhizobium septentrionale]|uniref:Uncharacterized protein n=1 Tax=Bradyrhizobium septentrionale TaxID=1404411 RepID=A0A974A0M0_9BRAD|nr:hypothetical protein [Bradyrhizobium septentrionale]UGY14174.1 hypothetical protein HAP48_0037300 [Bradyrhizobium septentrionale]